MKRVGILMFFLPALLIHCGSKTQLAISNADTLVYSFASAESEQLRTELQLRGIASNQEIEMMIRFHNKTEKGILIPEITLATGPGLRTSPDNMRNGLLLPGKKDSVLYLHFRPVNNLALYQRTGLRGLLTERYDISVSYLKPDDTGSSFILALTAEAPEQDYHSYQAQHKQQIFTYAFNNEHDFVLNQREYLNELRQTVSSFVHLTDQEVVVSGLNVRLKAYQEADTLYVGLTFINHSNLDIKVDTASIDVAGEGSFNGFRNVTYKKISGVVDDPGVLLKGERLTVMVKKQVGNKTGASFRIPFHEIFRLGSGALLFHDDVELIRVETSV